jgi:hypothetical protein
MFTPVLEDYDHVVRGVKGFGTVWHEGRGRKKGIMSTKKS